MSTAQPPGQARNAWGRDHGNFASVAAMPNGSGNALPSASVPYTLEAGDRCYLAQSSTTGLEYICVSAGTSGGGNAVWVVNTGQGPWSSVLYVDNARGSDVTGTRGADNLPFATIQAAINAAQSNDEIWTAPQFFALTAELTVPAALTSFCIIGQSAGSKGGLTVSPGNGACTVIRQLTAGQAVLNLGTNLGLSICVLRNLVLRGAGTTENIVKADGSAYAKGAFVTIVIENCSISTGVMFFKYARLVQVYGGVWNMQTLTITTCGAFYFYGCDLAGPAIALTYDKDDPLSVASGGVLSMRMGTLCNVATSGATAIITMSKQAQLVVDSTSAIGGVKGSGLTVDAGNTLGPSVSCCGYIQGGNSGVLDFASAGSELPDTALALTFDFRGTTLFGIADTLTTIAGVTTAKFKVGGAAGNFQTVKLDNADALPATTFTADAKIHLTMRGAIAPQPVYTTPGADGDIVPPMLTGTIDISAGGAVAKTWVQLGYAGLIRTGAAPDTAFLTASAQLSDPVITTKAVTGLTITSNVIGGDTACNWMAVWK